MSKHTETSTEEKLLEATKIKNQYIESLKDQISMLQEQTKSLQSQQEAALNRLMSMFEQSQRLLEDCI